MSTTIDANVVIPNQSFLVTPSDGPKDCLIDKKNFTLVFENAYNGVPDNLLINGVAFVLLVLLFGILRKKAWNYGRLALLHKTENRWMELFYGDNDTREAEVTCIEACVNSQLSHTDRGFLSWIVTAFKLPDEELLKRAGPDGLLYISFQRHLMILTAMMTVTSLLIILPINSTGDPVDKETTAFTHTTLQNLNTNSSLLWIHTIILLSYLPIGAYVMRHYIRRVRDTKPAGELAARTLLITEIPKHQCTVEGLTEYFKEAFPTLSIEDVTLAYDVRELSRLDAERDCAEQARLYCENFNRRKGPLKLYPHPCGRIVGCCFKQKQVDALEFYSGEEARLAALIDEERKIALSRPIGVAFVTLGTPGAARTMRRQLRSSPSIQWIVDYAPAPADIYWENLSIARPCWYLTWITSNCVLGLVLFFLTAPAIILSRWTLISALTDQVKKWSPMISSLLPSVILVSVTALMPAMVGRIEMLVRHWTRSGMNRAVMRKTLLLLLLMVLIFPSLGQPSVDALLKNFISDNSSINWSCIFLPDRGALFVNYVITAGLLGSGLELVRFPELALYTFRLCTARSRAERIYVRKAVLWEYPLGAHYAWLLLVFTMTTVYSLACPLITPFALMYLSIKHLVDRHNLCFAYGPSVGGGQLASAAANYTGLAPILAQFAFLALGLARSSLNAITAVQLCGLAASILGLVTGVTLPASKPKTQTSKRDFSAGQHFVAPVLRKKLNTGSPEETVSLSTTAQSSPSTKVYTTSSSTQGSPKLYQNYNTEPTNV